MSGEIQIRRESSHNAIAARDEQQAVAEVQAAIVVAKKFPRDEKEAETRIASVCGRQSLAERAVYSLPRGKGKPVKGPSIHLAKALSSAWQNIEYGHREVEQTAEGSSIEAFAWDKETNVRCVRVEFVPAKRKSGDGIKHITDPIERREWNSSIASRLVRDCILSLIPSDIVEKAREMCEETVRDKNPVTPAEIKNTLAAFAKYGVTKEQIEALLRRKLESMEPGNLVHLRQIHSSLRDGIAEASDFFKPVGQQAAAAEKLNTPKALPPASPPDDVHQGEAIVEESQDGPPTAFEELCDTCRQCQSAGDFRALDNIINTRRREISDEQFAELSKRIKVQKAEAGVKG